MVWLMTLKYFFDKPDPSDPTKTENFWRTKPNILTPYGLNVVEWPLTTFSGSFKFAHFNISDMDYVTKCQVLKCFVLARHWRTKLMYVILSPLLKVIYYFVCLFVGAFKKSACWLYRMFMICINQIIDILVNFFPFVIS